MVTGCPEGTYGAGCSSQCPGCRNDGVCDSVTGQCKCTPGFIGDICDQSKDLFLLYGIKSSTNKQNLSFGIKEVAMNHPIFVYNRRSDKDKEMGKNTKLENFVSITNVFICIINRILQYVSILHNFGYILVFYY